MTVKKAVEISSECEQINPGHPGLPKKKYGKEAAKGHGRLLKRSKNYLQVVGFCRKP